MTEKDAADSDAHCRSLNVWALEPYFGGSHESFFKGLVRESAHRFSLLTLPGRNWKWRMHGGAISLAQQACAHHGEVGKAPQVYFASDMLDLPLFLAMTGPRLGRVPTMVYFHENQLTYPLPEGVERDLGYGFKNLASAAVADAVLFNSDFHRREFLSAAADLVSGMPDEVPRRLVEEVSARSRVLPVGCDLRRFDDHVKQAGRDQAQNRWGDSESGPLILWNQRWEYDKAPGALFEALYALKEMGAPFRLAMAGANQGMPTAEFVKAKEVLADHIVQWGNLKEVSDYASLLWGADMVVSTALHEFFGVAAVEAVYCGCRPVLPKRLSYPELIPVEAQGDVLYEEDDLVPALGKALAQPNAWSKDWQRSWVAHFDWGAMRGRYDEEIRRCWETVVRPPLAPEGGRAGGGNLEKGVHA